MSGISGAKVVLTATAAHKIGGDVDRTIAQGAWLSRHRAPGLPRIIGFGSNGYLMERLEEGDGKPAVQDVVDVLRRDVWSKPGEVEFDEDALTLKVTKIIDEYAPHYTEFLNLILDPVFSASRTVALAHGDPTSENVMRRTTGELVLIDPLPATPAIPDLIEVDCGKMMQSAVGWELIRGNSRVTPWTPFELHDAIGDDLFDAAQSWGVIHLLRTLPYTTEEVREDVLKHLLPVMLGF